MMVDKKSIAMSNPNPIGGGGGGGGGGEYTMRRFMYIYGVSLPIINWIMGHEVELWGEETCCSSRYVTW